jgi:hypothetical protein
MWLRVPGKSVDCPGFCPANNDPMNLDRCAIIKDAAPDDQKALAKALAGTTSTSPIWAPKGRIFLFFSFWLSGISLGAVSH